VLDIEFSGWRAFIWHFLFYRPRHRDRRIMPRPFLPSAAREHVVELAGGFGLHGREDVRVGVERDTDLGVAEPLLNDLGMDALREQTSASSSVADVCRLVPQAVEPALGKARLPQ
jgi:hypothetical protein